MSPCRWPTNPSVEVAPPISTPSAQVSSPSSRACVRISHSTRRRPPCVRRNARYGIRPSAGSETFGSAVVERYLREPFRLLPAGRRVLQGKEPRQTRRSVEDCPGRLLPGPAGRTEFTTDSSSFLDYADIAGHAPGVDRRCGYGVRWVALTGREQTSEVVMLDIVTATGP